METETSQPSQEAEILSAILDELRKQRVPDDLWTADDIASYLKKSKSTVQGKITCHRGFPRPVLLPTGGKLWVPKEVRQWAMNLR